jgi:hypothetical protein
MKCAGYAARMVEVVCVPNFNSKNVKVLDQLGNLGVAGKIILMSVLGNRTYGCGWINLAQGRDQRRALVNTKMNLRVP